MYGPRTGRLRYYYEVVECGRGISFTVIAAFVRANSAAQVSITFLFAVVFVSISEAVSVSKECRHDAPPLGKRRYGGQHVRGLPYEG